MKKLGIVGGIGPASTLDYYKGLNDGYKARTGSTGNPPMIIDSLDLDIAYRLVEQKKWQEFTALFVNSLRLLIAGKADFAVLAANTAHIVFDDIQKQIPIPLLSIVYETCKAAQKAGCKKVILFGTAFTMSSELYTKAFQKYGIEAIVPNEEDQHTIHHIIFPNLQNGLVLPEDKSQMLGIAKKMLQETGADALILGCTELPLIIQEGDLNTLLLDTTQIHIDRILDYLLEE